MRPIGMNWWRDAISRAHLSLEMPTLAVALAHALFARLSFRNVRALILYVFTFLHNLLLLLLLFLNVFYFFFFVFSSAPASFLYSLSKYRF